MNKIKTAFVFGIGYVLGAQAGRARYEELKQQARKAMEHPKTQEILTRTRRTVSSRMPTRLPGHRDSALDDTIDVRPDRTPDITEIPATEPSPATIGTTGPEPDTER